MSKSVFVTGGAKGIGRGIVERFVADGHRVVIADVDEAEGTALAAELGDAATFVRTDATDEASVDAMVARTVELHGQLDVAINNAGIILAAPFVDTAAKDFRTLMNINVTGVFLTAQAASRQMISQGHGGNIINASSGAGRKGGALFSAYSASKFAIIGLTQSMALELAQHKIRVNAYAPGHTMTPLWDQIAAGFGEHAGLDRDQVIEQFKSDVPWGRFGTPKDVANACAWLISDESDYVVGQTIGINGGELPWN